MYTFFTSRHVLGRLISLAVPFRTQLVYQYFTFFIYFIQNSTPGLRRFVLTMGFSPSLPWVSLAAAEEPDSRVVVTTADVVLECSISAASSSTLLPASSSRNLYTVRVVFAILVCS